MNLTVLILLMPILLLSEIVLIEITSKGRSVAAPLKA